MVFDAADAELLVQRLHEVLADIDTRVRQP